MIDSCHRRAFLHQVAGYGLAVSGVQWADEACGADAKLLQALPKVPEHTLVTISGKPRDRGRQYGRTFKDAIHGFLDKEIYRACAARASREELLRYAGDCGKAIQAYSPTITEELEGIAEGAGLKREEAVLLSMHEETAGHRGGNLPPQQHCTALAAGPPDTKDGNTYVGQNWDWMASVYGTSQMLLWKRPEGPSVLAYSYPGLWIAAGLNSAGLAVCWTWGDERGIKGPRVGIPAYVLIAQMLYQDTLKGAVEEVRRSRHAGWFAFVVADSKGQITAIDATPEKLVVQPAKGHTARASYACREILGGDPAEPLKLHGQCRRMFDLLFGSKGKLDRAMLEGFFGDHKAGICKHPGVKEGGGINGNGFTVDSMLFDCTRRQARVSRGPGCLGRWQTFTFDDKLPAKPKERTP